MLKISLRQRAVQWLAVAALFSFVGMGVALAQAEPTMKQIYDAAQSGKLEQAQTMVQQVLISHPNSAKAHFVQAELFAKQGDASRAREALVRADKLAPGLPFAKPEAVQALRTQLASKSGASALKEFPNRVNGANATREAAPAAPASSFPVGLGLALGGGAIALVIFLMRKKPAVQPPSQAAYGNQSANSTAIGSGLGGSGGLNGPQTFGNAGPGGNGMSPGYGQPGNAQQGYGQPGYGQPAAGGMGMGGRVMGGLATGLAVGAGVMAAQAIGKNLMGNNNEHSNNQSDNFGNSGNSGNAGNSSNALTGNSDLGGQNFGVNDTGSWDDGGSASADSGDGGGDWDA